MKLILYHGTSEKRALQIQREGFKPDNHYNWGVKSKKGFVYLSSAYSPFYAMAANRNGNRLAIIKVEVDEKDIYPEDDFVMCMLGYPKYNQAQIDGINLKRFKKLANMSLQYMGNVAVKPENVKILGVRCFDGKRLLWKCDPVISPINFRIMGDYYKGLTEWIFDGKDFMEYSSFTGLDGGVKP